MRINAKSYRGELTAPSSKSYGQRLLILAKLSQQPCQILQLGSDRDTIAMQAALENIEVQNTNDSITEIHVGESGFALRTLAFVARHFLTNYRLVGTGTLLKRTHWATIQLLKELGFQVNHNNGYLPIEVSGSITNTRIEVDGSEGSQFVSGLFLLAAKYPGNWQIRITQINSQPYFNMTLASLVQFGFTYEQKDFTFNFNGAQKLGCAQVVVEGDWSSMAAHLVGAAMKGELSIKGLQKQSLQPDKKLLEILKIYGATVNWDSDELFVKSSSLKNPFHFDCTQQPDLFPVLVVLACSAHGPSTLLGINRLKNKESDRLAAMCEAMDTWGVQYHIHNDEITIFGSGKVKGGSLRTHNDHRIVMAACISSLISQDPQILDDTSAIAKSYPQFLTDFAVLTEH
jgi:3-phosphoshikimate 1-carboxyvinyltransferase